MIRLHKISNFQIAYDSRLEYENFIKLRKERGFGLVYVAAVGEKELIKNWKVDWRKTREEIDE